VNITIDSPGIVGAQFALTFDPTKIQIDAIEEGTFFAEWDAANPSRSAGTGVVPNWIVNNATGTVSAGAVAVLLQQPIFPGEGPTGSGALATITFHTVGATTGAPTSLHLTDVVFSALQDDGGGGAVPAASRRSR